MTTRECRNCYSIFQVNIFVQRSSASLPKSKIAVFSLGPINKIFLRNIYSFILFRIIVICMPNIAYIDTEIKQIVFNRHWIHIYWKFNNHIMIEIIVRFQINMSLVWIKKLFYFSIYFTEGYNHLTLCWYIWKIQFKSSGKWDKNKFLTNWTWSSCIFLSY